MQNISDKITFLLKDYQRHMLFSIQDNSCQHLKCLHVVTSLGFFPALILFIFDRADLWWNDVTPFSPLPPYPFLSHLAGFFRSFKAAWGRGSLCSPPFICMLFSAWFKSITNLHLQSYLPRSPNLFLTATHSLFPRGCQMHISHLTHLIYNST